MAITVRSRQRCAALIVACTLTVAQAQPSGEDTARYRLTDEVVEITTGTTMFEVVWEFYPEYKNRWLDVAADLVAANPHAFRRGDPGDVIVGQRLTLIEYTDDQAARRRTEPVPAAAAATPPAETAPAAARADEAQPIVAQPPAALPAVQIGRITAIVGTVRAIDAQQQTREMTLNSDVLRGDTLVTGPQAGATLTMVDQGRVELAADSQVVFEGYSFGARATPDGATLTFLKGHIRIATGAIASEDSQAVFVNTPMATIGTKVAILALRLCVSGACRDTATQELLLAGLYVGVLDGQLGLANNTGNLTLAKGDFVRVRNQDSEPDLAIEAAGLLFEPAQLRGLDIRRDEPLGFWAWLRERFF